jgi:hypothetical protein
LGYAETRCVSRVWALQVSGLTVPTASEALLGATLTPRTGPGRPDQLVRHPDQPVRHRYVLPLASPVATTLPERLKVTACTPELPGSTRVWVAAPVAMSHR